MPHAPPPAPPVREGVAFVLRLLPRSLAAALGLAVLATLAEGAAVLLLVPLLRAAGLRMEGGVAGRVADAVEGGLAAVGVAPTLGAMLLLYVGAVLLQALTQWGQGATAFVVNRRAVHLVRTRLFAAVLEARWPFVAATRSSDFVHALTAETDRVGVWTATLLTLAHRALVALLYLLLALRISVPLTAVALGAGGVLVALQRGTRRRVSQAGRQISDANAEVLAAAAEGVQGAKTIKSHGAERRVAAGFAARSGRALELYRGAIHLHTGSRAVFTAGSAAVLALVVWVALEGLALPAGVALLLIFLFSRMVPQLSVLQQQWQLLLHDLPALAAVTAMLARCEAARESAAGDAPAISLEREVRLDAVTFAHPGREPTVRGLDLALPARRTTALVGPSGTGKTTVADLLMGLVAPDSGRVEVDGRELAPEWLGRWRAAIGYVAQDGVLFHDTVRANLLWARPEANEADVREALRAAAAEEFVDALPQGLDTVVGDRGERLSGGERQRLALARALLRRPTLLILDEATSALDAENERRILEAVAALHGRTTILLITHRLATVRGADVIHVLEGGRVAESGSWDELAERPGGRFRAMVEAQGHAAEVRGG